MKEITVTLYQFDELPTDAAKEKARDWWREGEAQEFGHTRDFYDDLVETAGLLGITFKQHPVGLMSGKTADWPNIWWALDVQGAGASFEGRYEYRKGSVAKVKRERPTDTEILRIALELVAIQKSYGYKLTATITTDTQYTHSRAMDADVFDPRGIEIDDHGGDDRKAVLQLMRDFADYIYEYIKDEYAYRQSDENVDDAIRANEYYFRADGTLSDD